MRIGRVRRIVVTGVLVAVAAGCGGGDDGGASEDEPPAEEEVSLEDWAEGADEICVETKEASDDLGLETADDVAERGDEAIELAEEAVAAFNDLEAPDGEDGDRVDDLLEVFEDIIDVQEELIEAAGDGDDELALVAVPVDNADVYEDGLDAAEEAGADECAEAFSERLDTVDAVEDLFEEAGELSEVRVGDCLAGLEDGDLRPEPCDSPEAEGSVRSTSVDSTSGCPDELVGRGSAGLKFCLELLVDPEDQDEVLEVGSCILLEDAADETVDVTEFACGDPEVTHVVVRSVRRAQECGPDDRRFDKTEAEIADSGRGEWCAQPTA